MGEHLPCKQAVEGSNPFGGLPLMEEISMDTSVTIKPWGCFYTYSLNTKSTVKLLQIDPGHSISYQKHFKRTEHWYVLEGKGIMNLGGMEFPLEKGEEITIDKEEAHAIRNPKKLLFNKPLLILEVSAGTFREDDIERLEDNYGRKGSSD